MRTPTRTTRWPLLRPSATIILALVSFSLLSLGHNLGHSHSIRHHHSPRSLNTSNPNFGGYNLRATAVTAMAGQTGGSSASSDSGDFSCGPGKECSNGACCGDSGWCGYGPVYCGDGCQSNCDAKASCGQYAGTANQTCPLNVCCSEFGFCGTTTEFCSGKCQSNCEQPKPSTGGSNVQTRIVGYWETWNLDHPCGTMNPSEIPVSMLTHLNIAFGYISHDFQITNMDGISPTMYQNAAAVKSQNPNLKVLIALGGWTFSDPGPWQDVFPTMASTAENRATFIRNALGWLSEYGYDGIDFDWEYPGADDRGGSDGDGENYTALLKELRAAIDASGKEYLVTFTAPSSYWYLRHFDITKMMEYVDWVNLMSYDLHGVWDSDNPIGNQVLAHTNLTEIDLALNLFWRNDVEPSKIVLGLGFYGRSFKLSSASCWRPGCDFSGPGLEGECTKSAGILSYREITKIIEKTGAKPYFDKEAAAKYLVYGGDNWISYDDEQTFKLKIDYANKMGLGGLMVWAVDQDDVNLSALSAITDPNLSNDDSAPFTLVDLHRLFSNEDYPTDDKNPKYGMVNFGNHANLGETDPNKTAFGFFLVAGESHAVSKLRRRAGDPEPFTFLDCPSDVAGRPNDEALVARVVCLNEDVEGCFRVMERGVEGTVIEMPDNCAPGTFARAISLNASDDQSIPSHLESMASSAVFEFTFDYNFNLLRKDTEQTSIRMDYASMPGFWDEIVDSEGVQSPDGNRLEDRFFSEDYIRWNEKFGNLNFRQRTTPYKVDKSISQTLFWVTINGCSIDGSQFGEGLGAYVDGSIHIDFEYGFSVSATIRNGKLTLGHSVGVLVAEGYSDLTYTIGGAGKLDINKANKENPAYFSGEKDVVLGHRVNAGQKGWASYKPYVSVDYLVSTINDNQFTEPGKYVEFNGLLSARVNSNIGPIIGIFPGVSDLRKGQTIADPTMSIPKGNIVYNSGPRSEVTSIFLGCNILFGMDVAFGVKQDDKWYDFEGPDINLKFESLAQFTNDATSGKGTCVDYSIFTAQSAWLNDVGDLDHIWPRYVGGSMVYDNLMTPSGEGTCYPDVTTNTKRSLPSVDEHQSGSEYIAPSKLESAAKEERSDLESLTSEITKRGKTFPGFGYPEAVAVTAGLIFRNRGNEFARGSKIISSTAPKLSCKRCYSCTGLDEEDDTDKCCGCISMDYRYQYRDKPPCATCNPDDGIWPGSLVAVGRSIGEGSGNDDEVLEGDEASGEYHRLEKRVRGTATTGVKTLKICSSRGNPDIRTRKNTNYPSFPANAFFPWDGIQNGQWDGISRYWGNKTADCSDWSVVKLATHDTIVVPTITGDIRAKYQTEHVFEGQLIADFFDKWLDKGAIHNQMPAPSSPTSKFSCALYEEHVMTGQHWGEATGGVEFIRYLMSELGSETKLDRLTIYQARPNRIKGSLFTGNQPTAEDAYTAMTEEEQLLAIKEMGMTFEYLRDTEVWNMFCATYDGIYHKMGEFDEWYAEHPDGGPATFNLQAEWKDYIRVVLDSLVRRTRDSHKFYLRNAHKQDEFLAEHWVVNTVINPHRIKITQVCKNMDPTQA